MSNRLHQPRVRRAGFTIIEVVLSLTVFLMMTLMFAAAFPLVVAAAQQSNSTSQAALLTQHKIDQLRAAGYSSLNYARLGATGLGIVDGQNADGSMDFTTCDSLLNYFPSGSTGTLAISPDTTSGVPAGQVEDVTVTITWSTTNGMSRSYTAATKIANN